MYWNLNKNLLFCLLYLDKELAYIMPMLYEFVKGWNYEYKFGLISWENVTVVKHYDVYGLFWSHSQWDVEAVELFGKFYLAKNYVIW